MARFYGKVGYGTSAETVPGVWEDVITEKSYFGTVTQIMRSLSSGDSVLGQLTFQTTISVVADAYALENFMNIKYVRWAGSNWIVTSVQVQRPRLILILGEVYNGPTAPAGTPSTP